MINFTKMHGLGNDYIYIDQTKGKNNIENIESFTKYVSDRHFGVGSDGVILIKESNVADVRMEIYNADGSQAQMCGNGIRCVGKYVYENGIVKNKKISVETLAGIKELQLSVEKGEVKEVTVNMGCAIWDESKKKIKIRAIDWDIEGTAVSMGNPHFVILTKDIDKIDLKKYGSYIEKHEMFPEGTNVEFIEVLGNNSIKMRVWERGSGETFACGTGACAAFAVCHDKKLVNNEATVHLLGGNLKIKIDELTNEIYMTGPATKICDGEIEIPYERIGENG